MRAFSYLIHRMHWTSCRVNGGQIPSSGLKSPHLPNTLILKEKWTHSVLNMLDTTPTITTKSGTGSQSTQTLYLLYGKFSPEPPTAQHGITAQAAQLLTSAAGWGAVARPGDDRKNLAHAYESR